MGNSDVDDVFKDFEHKVEGKKGTSEKPQKEMSEEEHLKRKYNEQKEALKEKHKQEMGRLEEKKKEYSPKGGKIPQNFVTTERIASIAIILVLVGYIVIDFSFYHGEKSNVGEEIITASIVEGENKTVEVEEETVAEVVEEVVEEKTYSGVVKFAIKKVYTTVNDNDDDLGYIEKISFIIENDQDKVLTPVIEAYIYDSEMDEFWETKIRGKYTFAAGITAGSTHTDTVTISPKSFRNLDVDKNIRLTLNDTKSGFIKVVNQEVTIS
ncbi:hypothetical protein CMO93_00470 [Candidatus Woesearchaeota archaeon]|nr:hypothetical protein [Candidatus Woesearchaeota archaeon]|tara:strand:+ start:102 stop:902 length:801 start_codon:yes stop_codon:yes gene_type:complete